MPFKHSAMIIGLGSYLPNKVMTNRDFAAIVDTSDEWIVSRTGIRERRIASESEFPSIMGAEAARKAMQAAGIQVEEIEALVVATMSPDQLCPSTAALIQKEIGASSAAIFDIQAACSGYLYGLSVAKAYVESGIFKNILFVATEKMSSLVDYSDRASCILFGDGATAAVVAKGNKGLAIRSISLGGDGCLGELLEIPAGGAKKPPTHETVNKKQHFLSMQGNEIFRHAVRRMASAVEQCLDKEGKQKEEIDWLVPHQANMRIIDALVERLSMDPEKVIKTLHKYGNTAASSIGIALDELMEAGRVKEGNDILLVAFGGGLTWGATLLTYGGR